ncbi:hypothetical protein ruthe_01423 [Rubellimicrobium thermophilum DSM 16684]|uniref:Uncharacterized protein n=1 Tax=Rubellimicrobium thermophilum DSM 16684 TaxID=1123069 RepID=S9QZ47_9RHOB|nr:hypothetical protein ruthe_01423 [Rubellimicrobium thermophilum DSM 16684]
MRRGLFVWRPDRRHLELTIEARARPLFGEVAQSRLNALARAMSATAEVRFGE